jgi:hypothetical protein
VFDGWLLDYYCTQTWHGSPQSFNSSLNFQQDNYHLCTLKQSVLVNHASAHAGTGARIVHFNLLKPSGFTLRTTSLTFKNSTWCSLCVVCFVWIWEQTAAFVLYNINWLVFINEMKNVYSAVRTGYLNKAVCASSVKGYTISLYNINWLVFITEMKSVYSAVRTGYLNRAVCASSVKGYTISLYNINWLVFITEKKSVYSAVRTGYLNKAVCASSLKG